MKNSALLLLLILLSCSTSSNNHLSEPVPADTEMIKSVVIQQDSIHFTVINGTPTPCYGFNSTKIESSNDVVSVKVYIQDLTNDPCITLLSSIETEITVPVESGNTYLFRFWKYGDATLDTTITIP